MAKNKVNTKNSNQKTQSQKHDVFKDPSETLIGKIVVGLIIFGTVAGIFIAAIIEVVKFFSK